MIYLSIIRKGSPSPSHVFNIIGQDHTINVRNMTSGSVYVQINLIQVFRWFINLQVDTKHGLKAIKSPRDI